ncbi:peptidase S8/S53 domain-containing protein [Lactarius quietus]|nr:peptidase S8/S53 domain-containing protein [Lactarius quietus]
MPVAVLAPSQVLTCSVPVLADFTSILVNLPIMRHYQFSMLSVLAAALLANFGSPLTPNWDDMRVKHAWNAVPSDWETLGHPPAVTTIDLHFALKPHHENALIDALYGAHLSKEQVAQLVRPQPDTLQLIKSWLEHHHIPPSAVSMTHGGGWLTVTDVPVSQANEMLGASYQLYRRSSANDTSILRTISYALPSVLHKHVQTVVPTTYFASPRTLRKTPWRRPVGAPGHIESGELSGALSNRDEEDEKEIYPSTLRSLYRTDTYVPAAKDKNILGIASFSKDYASHIDLTTFMRLCRADAIDATFEVEQINNGEYNPSEPSIEANQNMQYAQAMAYPTPHIFYSNGGKMVSIPGSGKPALEDTFQAWLNYLITQETVPRTISTSYGDPEESVPLEYAKALCDLYAQLGSRGVSVLVPSGNDGVGDGDCIADEDTGRVQFMPEFPSSCPWVTSVGGTTQIPEKAAELSGGGFSDYFPRPIYQDPAVPTFLERLGNQYNGMYNPAGRGIPDVAGQALTYFLVSRRQGLTADGTSCATPTVAGIISLLNDYLLSKGKKPLGFLNPWLYGLGVVGMNDIKSGSNPGCGTEGFSAIAGWDPVTGLGTPDFLNLQAIIDYMSQFTPPASTTAQPSPTG